MGIPIIIDSKGRWLGTDVTLNLFAASLLLPLAVAQSKHMHLPVIKLLIKYGSFHFLSYCSCLSFCPDTTQQLKANYLEFIYLLMGLCFAWTETSVQFHPPGSVKCIESTISSHVADHPILINSQNACETRNSYSTSHSNLLANFKVPMPWRVG